MEGEYPQFNSVSPMLYMGKYGISDLVEQEKCAAVSPLNMGEMGSMFLVAIFALYHV